MLIARGLITPKQLNDALEHQKEKGHRRLLGETLVELCFVTDHDVMAAVADSYGIPFARDIARIADPHCLEVLPREYLLEHLVLPLFLVRDMLTVAVAEPANLYLFEEIRRRTNKQVQIVATTPGEIRAALDAYVPAANVFVIDDIVGDVDEQAFSVIEREVAEIEDLREVAGHSPVVKTVNWLLWNAVHEGASDIHIEPVIVAFACVFASTAACSRRSIHHGKWARRSPAASRSWRGSTSPSAASRRTATSM